MTKKGGGADDKDKDEKLVVVHRGKQTRECFLKTFCG